VLPFNAMIVARGGLERGEIGWRDLADFDAGLRWQIFNFP